MTVKLKPQNPYWTKFSVYQTFESVKDMNSTIKQFFKTYMATPATKAVLNTLKLHSKTFAGVSWMYIDEIAKKAKVSRSSVKRAIKDLKEVGIVTVYENMHTERGGKTHNVYVINPTFGLENEPSELVEKEPTNPVVVQDTDISGESHKNLNKNPNTNLKDLSIKIDDSSIDEIDILKHVPNEFVELLKPYYGHSPEVIRARWKTVLSAVKNNCVDLSYTSWETIDTCWKKTVKALKRGRIRVCTDDGVGAYFYGVLSDYLFNDFWRNGSLQA